MDSVPFEPTPKEQGYIDVERAEGVKYGLRGIPTRSDSSWERVLRQHTSPELRAAMKAAFEEGYAEGQSLRVQGGRRRGKTARRRRKRRASRKRRL